MRKDILALGLILFFAGLVLVATSQIAVKQEPTKSWLTVAKVEPQQPSYNMSVEGTLAQGDKFRVYFKLGRVSGPFIEGAAVLINLTDPNEYSNLYDVSIGSVEGILGILEPFPEGVANHTGTYKANAQGLAVSLSYLSLQKMKLEEKEPLYPYSTFFPAGSVICLGGVGILILSNRMSRHKRRLSKTKA